MQKHRTASELTLIGALTFLKKIREYKISDVSLLFFPSYGL
jgi:hypothetical protein